MRKHPAFTLVEMLIVLVITGIVMGAVISIMFSVFKSYEIHQDITEAKQRGHIALATIQPLILNAGVGLPGGSASDFREAFEWYHTDGSLKRFPLLFPASPGASDESKNFGGFIQLADDATDRSSLLEAPALWLVYSVPSGIRINAGIEAFEGVRTDDNKNQDSQLFTSATISMSGAIDSQQLLDVYPPTSLKGWVSFPTATPSSPFSVADISGASLKLRSHSAAENNMIAPFDELHYVRAAKIFVENNTLKIDRLDGAGAQSVADGVIGMWCTFVPTGDRVLTLNILARASTKRTPGVQSDIVGWPASAATHWQGTTDGAYRHSVVSRSWRIRN